MKHYRRPATAENQDGVVADHRRSARRRVIRTTAIALGVLLAQSAWAGASPSDNGVPGAGSKWVASWTTAIQSAYVAPDAPQGPAISAYDPQPDLTFPLPGATANGADNQSMRMIIKPDLWGEAVRVRFSNVFGTKPVTFASASVALQDYQANLVHGSSETLTFSGRTSVTVQPGQQVFSDGVRLPYVTEQTIPLLRGRNLAVSFAVRGRSGPASYHAVGLTTSYISPPGSGNVTGADDDVAYPYTTTSFFFVSELDVLAPKDTLVVCAFGDSITDGDFSTVNGSDRWANVLSRQLHDRFGDHVSVVNEGIDGNAVVASLTGQPATQRVTRDVLGLSGVNFVIWLEGINDLGGAGSAPATVMSGYRQVANILHAANVKVIGATLTSSFVPGGQVPANSPLIAYSPALAASYGSKQTDSYRRRLNDFILTNGIFDGVADFAAATTDPDSGTLYPPFVPNSEGSAGDYLHLSRAGYQAMGISAADAVFRATGNASH